jgi:hypothetical protein
MINLLAQILIFERVSVCIIFKTTIRKCASINMKSTLMRAAHHQRFGWAKWAPHNYYTHETSFLHLPLGYEVACAHIQGPVFGFAAGLGFPRALVGDLPSKKEPRSPRGVAFFHAKAARETVQSSPYAVGARTAPHSQVRPISST